MRGVGLTDPEAYIATISEEPFADPLWCVAASDAVFAIPPRPPKRDRATGRMSRTLGTTLANLVQSCHLQPRLGRVLRAQQLSTISDHLELECIIAPLSVNER
jgi:hypothetical protein